VQFDICNQLELYDRILYARAFAMSRSYTTITKSML